jgi:hypothetical protein
MSAGGYNRIDSRQPNLPSLSRRGEGRHREGRQGKILAADVLKFIVDTSILFAMGSLIEVLRNAQVR